MHAMSQPKPTIGTVIAPDQSALQVGSAKFIVDGTDTTLLRKAEIALRRPSTVSVSLQSAAPSPASTRPLERSFAG